MDNPESDWPTEICPGHKLGLNSKCRNCSEDYDTSHFPNNYDCVIYNRFLKKYQEVASWFTEKGVKMKKETLETLSLQIFLANIVNPGISIDKILRDMSHIRELRDIPCTKKAQKIYEECYSSQTLSNS